MAELEQVLVLLRGLRAPLSTDEYELHRQIAGLLHERGLAFEHEKQLMPRCRIDFFVGGVGVEVKRGRPNRSALLRQAERYLSSGRLSGIILVCEQGLEMPESILGLPCRVLSLRRLWGPANPLGSRKRPAAAPEPPAAAEAEEPSAIPTAATGESLPAYLRPHEEDGHLYGTLSYNARSKAWQIKGDPAVTEMAKRLFPGSDSGKRGLARFTAHRRIVGDLNWLMQRYPLAVAARDRDRWQQALREAQDYEKEKRLLFDTASLPEPPEGSFLGQLRAFQKLGAGWLCRVKRGLLADEMGLGKTVQALAALAATGSFPCLIVVPPHLSLNWQSEIRRFLRLADGAPRVHVLRGLRPYPLPEADIYLVHYLLLRGWKEALPLLPVRAVIFDEVQELRHTGTEKYSAASLLSSACERVWGLSGTPIYNQGGEIWNVVNILDYHFLGDWESFSREWCYGYGNAVVIHPELLGEHLRREGMMLRRTKKEVLPELPDKRRLVQEIDADSALYKRLMQPVLVNLQKLSSGDLSPSQRALLEDRISQDERQAAGLAKAPFVAQFVRALVESGEKVLLFAHHHAVMDSYHRELHTLSPAFITGRETQAQKQKSVERFMEGRTDLCCVSLRAASGLNLQRATAVVFGELDWSPAVHSQAEDRAHRIGQKDSLLCYYLVSPGGSDADIQEHLGLKVSQFMGLMGESAPSAQSEAQDAAFARRHAEKLLLKYFPGGQAAV